MICTLVIPVRSFADAKSRLTNFLPDHERIAFMQDCVNRVVCAGKDTREINRIVLVSGSDDVLKNADSHEIETLKTDAPLNEALREYRMFHMEENLLISLGDLPLVANFDPICSALDRHQVVMSPDRHRSGTNILSHQFNVDVSYRFGEASFTHHLSTVEKKRFSLGIISRPEYGFDIDTPDDYGLYTKLLKA